MRRCVLLLALPPDEFERTSVALPDSVWSERFRDLLCRHRAEVLPPDAGLDATAGGPDDVFSRTNRWMIERALRLVPPATLRVALVWDEAPAGGPGAPVTSPSSPTGSAPHWRSSTPPG